MKDTLLKNKSKKFKPRYFTTHRLWIFLPFLLLPLPTLTTSSTGSHFWNLTVLFLYSTVSIEDCSYGWRYVIQQSVPFKGEAYL